MRVGLLGETVGIPVAGKLFLASLPITIVDPSVVDLVDVILLYEMDNPDTGYIHAAVGDTFNEGGKCFGRERVTVKAL